VSALRRRAAPGEDVVSQADGKRSDMSGPVTPHDHGDNHPHRHPGQRRAEAPPAGAVAAVMVDVGDGYGALVLHAGPDRVGLEPEIHPAGRPADRQHVWVLEREAPGPSRLYAAVFPSLAAGRYVICSPQGVPAKEVEVVDEKITETDWD
jgi:hypothetical protein